MPFEIISPGKIQEIQSPSVKGTDFFTKEIAGLWLIIIIIILLLLLM